MKPKITIVTPSFNQGCYIDDTIKSVLDQGYPNLEYIIVDGASTDDTLEILQKYRLVDGVTVISEPDNGHSDAINKGFDLATGDIYGFLNSDDTLEPGALECVSQGIDPLKNRHVVMGRCRFIDQYGRYLGIEHPCQFESHRRLLKIWKGHMVPQPSTFWTAEAWRRCGKMDVTLRAWLDYDFFCRLSRNYFFHRIDSILANYRLHETSVTTSASEEQRLSASLKISRRYWGKWIEPSFWDPVEVFGLLLKKKEF